MEISLIGTNGNFAYRNKWKIWYTGNFAYAPILSFPNSTVADLENKKGGAENGTRKRHQRR